MDRQIALDPSARADGTRDHGLHEVTGDLAYKRTLFVNVALYGIPRASDRRWTLIDTGIVGAAGRIAKAAAERFGKDSRPCAIIMTHGHFDHAGNLEELTALWDVPAYAHPLEMPYLDGRAAYPPGDASVGGGMMSALSPYLPTGPTNAGQWLRPLPEDGSVPGMAGWRWLHTPGHTPGHISLWRDVDRTIIAGDAFITTNMESAYAAVTQRPEMHGPPMFITQDWTQARMSVQRLARLAPELALTGHGHAMHGAAMRSALRTLARDFERVAVPEKGRYVSAPVSAESGTAYAPPP